MSKQEIFNFSAGPAMLPHEVHQQIINEWPNWQGMNVPLVEVGHRTEQYMQLMDDIDCTLRELLTIPSNYKILFLHGGAQTQFSLVPMNLLGKNHQADYLVYGHWAERAYEEAKRYGEINGIAARSTTLPYEITDQASWALNPEAAYLHYCTNETIDGMMLPFIPESKAPLVADMSSDILSKPIDVSRFGLIYACTQKNMGVVGLAVVIVRQDLLDQSMSLTPSVLNYKKQTEARSLLNTTNTFACYVLSLVLAWIKKQGGLKVLAEINARKAKKLYDCIDQSNFYSSKVSPRFRSMMNVCFNLPTPELEAKFLEQAETAGLYYLRGHKVSGGIRASIYNAMPETAVDQLVQFMKSFER